MADTFTTDGLTVEQWEDKYFVEHINYHPFKPYMGNSANAMIHYNEDLSKKPGDKVTFPLVHNLKEGGQTGSSTLEGNEEELAQRSFKVIVDQYRHAVRLKKFEMQKSAIDQMNAVKDVLSNWNTDKDHNKIIDALNSTGHDPTTGKPLYKVVSAGANSVATGATAASQAQMNTWLANNADRVLFGAAKSNNDGGDHASSLSNVDESADKLTGSALKLMKRMAKTATPRIRPFKLKNRAQGSDMFVMFAPSLLIRDLSDDPAFLQANREARNRGKNNPIFTGADYVYDNIAIIEDESIPVFPGAGAGGIDVAPCFLCGAQALAMAFSRRPFTIEEKFDYGDKHGRGVEFWYEIAKFQFGNGADQQNPVDHGVVTGYFAAVADS